MKTVARAFICITILSNSAQGHASESAGAIAGTFLQIFFHESGHAAVAAAHDYEIRSFRPYPHICGGRLVGGCVEAVPTEPLTDSEGNRNEEAYSKARQVSAAGSLFSGLGVLAFAPLQQYTNGGFSGSMLDTMLTLQTADMFFYTMIDTMTDFQGDWYAVSQNLGVPTWYFIPVGALNYYLLKSYRDSFRKNSSSAQKSKSAPQIVLMNQSSRETPDLALSWRWDF